MQASEVPQKQGMQADIEMERDWNKATANRDYVLFPNRPPYKRKGRNRWTDANEQDIARQCKYQIFFNQ